MGQCASSLAPSMSKLVGLYVWSTASSVFLQEAFTGPQKNNPVAYCGTLWSPLHRGICAEWGQGIQEQAVSWAENM